MSSSCSGGFTAEVAAALVEKVVNESELGNWNVRINWESCHVSQQHLALDQREAYSCVFLAMSGQPHHQWVSSWSGRMRGVPHVFGDMLLQVDMDFEAAGLGGFASKAEKVKQADFHSHQYCFAHGRQCSLWDCVDFDFSGLPCEDNSRMNFKRKFEEGRYAPCYMTWSKKHRAMKTPLLILENTPASRHLAACSDCTHVIMCCCACFHNKDIKLDMLEQLFGDGYMFLQLFVEPAHAGHGGVARRRTYIYIVNLEKTIYLHDVYDLYKGICDRIRMRVQTRPRDYMVAPGSARAAYRLALRQRRSHLSDVQDHDC